MIVTGAFVRMICDDCEDEQEAALPFNYQYAGGASGRYDHANPLLPDGWVKLGKDRHRCLQCKEERGMSL